MRLERTATIQQQCSPSRYKVAMFWLDLGLGEDPFNEVEVYNVTVWLDKTSSVPK